ncbi:MAG: hypothetical protein AAGB19_02830 [Cyanobacteria bacterium P01_F01_bin.3]
MLPTFLDGYTDALRLDFTVAPAQDAVILAGHEMIVLTLDQPPGPQLLQELNTLREEVSPAGGRGYPVDEASEQFNSAQRSFYIPLRSTYCPDKTGEAIATELETRYGLRVLRKRSRSSNRKYEPRVVKRFTQRRDSYRADDSQRAKRLLNWNGLKLGLQYLPGDMRHNRRLTAAYGHVRGTYGMADDGMSFDVWVNLSNPLSKKVFKLQQLTFGGDHDEYKYILGVDSKEEARQLYGANMPRQLIGRVTHSTVKALLPSTPDRGDAFYSGYDDVMRADQRGQGVPCGSSWISRAKKCSKEKASQTPKEAKQRGVEKARDRLKLKRQIKASTGQRVRTISEYEARERRGQMTLPLSTKSPKSSAKGSGVASDRKIASMSESEFLEGRDPKSQLGKKLVQTRLKAIQRHQRNTVKDYEDRFGKFMTETDVNDVISALGTGRGGVKLERLAGRSVVVQRNRPSGKRGSIYAIGTYDRNGKLNINTMSAAGNATQAKHNYLEAMDMLPGGKNDYTK